MQASVRVAGAVVGVSVGVAGVARARRTRTEPGRCERRLVDLRRERDRLNDALRRREAELIGRRSLIERLQRGRRAERGWNDELRAQLQREHASRSGLEDSADPRDLILRPAIKLVEAEKGLLLSREDEDADGRLDLVCAHGFEHDPAQGSVVQRFAREVLERDQIVREDAPAREATPWTRRSKNPAPILLYLRGRFGGVIVCANRRGGFEELDDDLLLALGDHAGTALQTERLQRDLHEAHRSAVRMLIDVLDARDPMLRREAGESALLARAVARRLGLGSHELEVLATAALIRDVGNVAIPERILLTQGPLSADERTLVEMHPRVGAGVIDEWPALHEVAKTVLYHHERLDGTGYPTGSRRRGDTRHRPGAVRREREQRHDPRPAPPRRSLAARAVAELTIGAGVRFDPQVVRALADEVKSSTAPHPELAGAVAAAIDTAGLPPLLSSPGPTRSRYCRDTERFTRPPPTSSRTTLSPWPSCSWRISTPSTAATAMPPAITRCSSRRARRNLPPRGSAGRCTATAVGASPSWSRASRPQAWQPNCTPSLPSVLASASDSTMGRPGETADDVIARAREAITDDATRSPEPPATGRDT